MDDTKKMDEASKPEALAERVELTDEQLDQASGGIEVGILDRNLSKIDVCKKCKSGEVI